MIELSNERIEQMLHEETLKTEELTTILRAVYTRYMRLYESYFADIDALDDDKIAELGRYREDTKSLVKYYYMDIPQDICTDLNEFEKEYGDKMLGSDWRKYLSDIFNEFKSKNKDKSEESLKADFVGEYLAAFYEEMDYIFRDGFDTGSRSAESFKKGFAGFFFGGS